MSLATNIKSYIGGAILKRRQEPIDGETNLQPSDLFRLDGVGGSRMIREGMEYLVTEPSDLSGRIGLIRRDHPQVTVRYLGPAPKGSERGEAYMGFGDWREGHKDEQRDLRKKDHDKVKSPREFYFGWFTAAKRGLSKRWA